MMSYQMRPLLLLCCILIVCSAGSHGEDPKPYDGPACSRNVDDYFAKEVWVNVGAVKCLQCHKKGGDAEESKLILQDPRKVQGHEQDKVLTQNRDAFARLARMKEGD